MRDPDFTSIDQMKNPNMDLNIAMKDNWQEANEAQSYNLADAVVDILRKMITTQR